MFEQLLVVLNLFHSHAFKCMVAHKNLFKAKYTKQRKELYCQVLVPLHRYKGICARRQFFSALLKFTFYFYAVSHVIPLKNYINMT